jgi:hypothetical protein
MLCISNIYIHNISETHLTCGTLRVMSVPQALDSAQHCDRKEIPNKTKQ